MSALVQRTSGAERVLRRHGRLVFTADHAGAASYASRVLFVPHGPRGRVLARFASSLPPRLHAAMAVHLLDRHAAAPSRVPSLAAAWYAGAGGELAQLITSMSGRADGWVALEDPHGADRGRLLLFLFPPGSDAPATVVKLRARAAGGISLDREWQMLRYLEAQGSEFSGQIPRPLDYAVTDDLEVMSTSALAGRSLDVAMRSGLPADAAGRHLVSAAAWLGAFHAATRCAGSWTPRPEERHGAARRVVAAGGDPAEAEELMAGVAGGSPVAAGHGDFWPRNLLVDRGKTVGVVDWEHGRAAAPCFDDLCHLLVTWTRRRDARREELSIPVAFRWAFVQDGHVAAAVRRAAEAYCAAAGIATEHLAGMLRLFVLTRPLAPRSRVARDPWSPCAPLLHATLPPWSLP